MTKYEIKNTTQFKKDYKLAKKRGLNIKLLKEVVSKLANGEQLESKYKDHMLSGNWSGHRECHIQPDWLLIYYVEDKEDEEEQQLFCDQTQILSGQYLSLYKPRDGYIWVLDNHDLYRIEGKEEKLISNSALWLQTLDNGEALIFENYDPNNQSGDLVYYDGKTNWLIEPDVKAFVYLDE